MLTGHRAALDLGADVCVVMAGDGQMDPDYLPALLDPIVAGRAQFTKANRFYGRGSFAGMPRMRVLGNIALSFLTKAASGYWNLFDPQNGYTAIHRDALVRIPWDQIARRYDFENDLLINLNILRVPAVDVPGARALRRRGVGDEPRHGRAAHRDAGSSAGSGPGCGGSTSCSPSPPSRCCSSAGWR